jgi:hypothetical protein
LVLISFMIAHACFDLIAFDRIFWHKYIIL